MIARARLQGLVGVAMGGVKIPGKEGIDGVVGMVVGNGNMEPVPTDGLEPNGGNVGKLGVWSVGIGKLLSPVLGSPGMFKRRRASRLLE
ncbi:hypothetical protein Tco_0582509 [Tanacetum coccineum]